MSIYMTARYTVRPEAIGEVQQIITEFVDYITRDEPETRLYVAMQEAENETQFLHFFIFENEHAEERHANSEAAKRFTDAIYPRCTEPVTFTTYQLIASTDE